MMQHADRWEVPTVRTPLWRRITALFTLSSLVIILGLALAFAIGTLALLAFFILERAISG